MIGYNRFQLITLDNCEYKFCWGGGSLGLIVGGVGGPAFVLFLFYVTVSGMHPLDYTPSLPPNKHPPFSLLV